MDVCFKNFSVLRKWVPDSTEESRHGSSAQPAMLLLATCSSCCKRGKMRAAIRTLHCCDSGQRVTALDPSCRQQDVSV